MASPNAAPTIDVSTLDTPQASNAPSIDMSAFDVPLTGKQTLPLFGVDDDDTGTLRPPPAVAARPTPPQRAASRGPGPVADGSLSPATFDKPTKDAERPDSVRERKNVIAPATKSVPPPTAPSARRSGLAAPVLLALAAAAGILIWKRGATPSQSMAHAEQPAAHAAATPPPLAPVPDVAVAPVEPPPVASVAAAAPTAADDVTFEATPAKPSAALTPTHETSPAPEAPTPAVEKPASVTATPTPTPVTPAPTPRSTPTAAPAIKDEPILPPPGKPAEPAGPFDRAAAAAALTTSAAQASACRKDGDPSGVASVVITFAPSGRVTSANVSGPPFAGTPTGGCIAAALRRAHVPPFEGERVTVSKTIVIQ
jgi:hypothetical protein